jgi:(+)-trans-carveol dehydrogenase
MKHSEQRDREIEDVTWNFQGKVVLITGAARGPGRTHALEFAKAGATLALCDVDDDLDSIGYPLSRYSDLEAVAASCHAHGAETLAQTCDVRDDRQVSAFVDDAVRELGRIDVAVANAGVVSVRAAVDMSERDWDDVVDTNLKGVFLTLRSVARTMIAAERGGSLIAIGSVNSFAGAPGSVHYSASKHGVLGLCRALAIELAPHGIRVNCVCPTAVNTMMLEALDDPRVPEDYGERLVGITGSWNLLQVGAPPLEPIEITQAILWLASDASRYVTGIAVPVDAGYLSK